VAFSSINEQTRFSTEKYQKNNLVSTDRSMLDVYCLLPGQRQGLHAHAENDKYYVIWRGEAEVTIGSETRTLRAGDVAVSVPGVEHSIANASKRPLVVLVFQAPKPF